MSLFVENADNKPQINGDLITPDTTPQQLGKIIESVKGYRDIDSISFNNVGPFNISLIEHLIKIDRIDLIKYLVNSRGSQILEIGDTSGYPLLMMALSTNFLRNHNYIPLVEELIDLGTPINLMSPDVTGSYINHIRYSPDDVIMMMKNKTHPGLLAKTRWHSLLFYINRMIESDDHVIKHHPAGFSVQYLEEIVKHKQGYEKIRDKMVQMGAKVITI